MCVAAALRDLPHVLQHIVGHCERRLRVHARSCLVAATSSAPSALPCALAALRQRCAVKAMRPHVRASSTPGVMESVVRTRTRSGESRHTTASSPVSEPDQQVGVRDGSQVAQDLCQLAGCELAASSGVVAELGCRRGCARCTRTPLRWPRTRPPFRRTTCAPCWRRACRSAKFERRQPVRGLLQLREPGGRGPRRGARVALVRTLTASTRQHAFPSGCARGSHSAGWW